MSEQAVFEALRRGLITPEQAKQRLKPTVKQERQVGTGEAAVRSFAQGITLGGVDELVSGIGAVGDAIGGKNIKTAYNDRLSANRSQDAMIAKQRPVTDTAGKIAGGVVGSVGAAMAAPASALLNPATAGQLAKSGMAYGGLQGLLSGEGVEGRVIQGTLGGLGGLATGYFGGRILDKVLPNATPTSQQLQDGYKASRDALRQVPIDRNAMNQALQPVLDDLRYVQSSVDPSVLGAIDDLKRAPNAYAADLVRSNINGKAPQGAQLRKQLDTFLETQNVDPAFRDQYRRSMLANKVQDAISRFDTSPAQARTALLNVAKNTKGIKPFEKEALTQAAKKPFSVGNLTSAVLSLAAPSPAGSAIAYGGGRLFDAIGDDASSAAMGNAFNTILNGKRMPSYLNRLGLLSQ